MTRAGQDRAFEVLVARYREPLHRFCARVLSPGRAEDAVQQTFINAYAAMKADEAKLNFKPWLYRIARNTSIDALRQSGWGDEELDPDGGVSEDPESAVERRQELAGAVAALQALPERQRDAVVLRELEGRSYEDIAVRLGVTDGAVRQLLYRARSSLRAAATSLTPLDLLYRLAARMPGGPPTPTRMAELTAGAGPAAAVPKVVAAVLVTGAIAGGVAAPPTLLEGADRATAAESPEPAGRQRAAVRGEGASPPGARAASRRRAESRRRGAESVSRRKGRRRGEGSEPDGRRASDGDEAGSEDDDQRERPGSEPSGEVGSEDAREGSSSGSGGEGSSSGSDHPDDVSGSEDDRDSGDGRDSQATSSASTDNDDETRDQGLSDPR